MEFSKVFIVCLLLICVVTANPPTQSAKTTTPMTTTTPAPKEIPSTKTDLINPTWSWSLYKITALTTAALVVGVGFAAITTIFLPVYVFKLCYILGGCRDTLAEYVNQLVVDNMGYRHINKRSIEYIGPLLDTLSKAYEKYADDGLKKKFKIQNF